MLALMRRCPSFISGWIRAHWSALQRWRAARSHDAPVHMEFEALEPRLLLSADLQPAAAGAVQSQLQAQPVAIDLTLAAAPASVQVTGAGSAKLTPQGSGFTLTVTGTDANSTVLLLGGPSVHLTGIAADSRVGHLVLANATLNGIATLPGGVAAMQIGALDGASLQVGGSGNFALLTGAIHASSISAPHAVATITADSLTTDTAHPAKLEVAALDKLAVHGEVSVDLLVNGSSPLRDDLGDVAIDGVVTRGVWSVDGRGRTITVKGTGADWRMNLAGTLHEFNTQGDASGSLAVGSVQTLHVGGDMKNMTVYVGADLGSDAALGGTGDAADHFAAGRLAHLLVDGQIIASNIYVSIDPVDGIYGNGNDVDLGTVVQRVQEVTVGGAQTQDGMIFAPSFPTRIDWGGHEHAPEDIPAVQDRHHDHTPPQVTAALRSDTGASASDGITRDATIVLTVRDQSAVSIQARSGTQAFETILPAVQRDGTFVVSTTVLAKVNGGKLPDGPYSFEFRATDIAGNRSSATVQFTLDTTKPDATQLQLDPAGHPISDLVTTADVVKIIGVTEAGVALTLRRANDGPTLGTTTAAANGSFSFSGVALPTIGNNGFTLVMTDRAGNSQNRDFTIKRQPANVDQTPPTLTAALQTDTGKSASDGITRDASVAGTASDNVAVTRLEAVLDPGSSPVFTNVTTKLQSNGSFVLDAAQLDTLAGGYLGDGAHTLRVRASDAAGNATTRDVTFTLDRTAPAAATLDLAAASDSGTQGDHITSASSVTLNGSAEGGAALALLRGATSLGTTTAASNGSFSFASVQLAAGSNTLTVVATDAAGNSTSHDFSFIRDNAAPTLAAALQADTGSSASDGLTRNPAVAGSATDALSGVARLEAVLDPGGTPVFTNLTGKLQANGSFVLDAAQMDVLAGGHMADGAHLLRLRATDGAGNTTSLDVSFTLDRAAPSMANFDLAPGSDTGAVGDQITSSASANLLGSTEAGAAVALMQGTASLATTTAAGNGSFSFLGVPLAVGSNTFTVQATDAAGNSSSQDFTFKRDSSTPALSAALQNDSGASASATITSHPELAGSVSDVLGVVKLEAVLDPGGTPVFTEVTGKLQPDGSFVLAASDVGVSTLADGTHTWRVRASDAAGNSSSVDVPFTLDTTAPATITLQLAPGFDSGTAGDGVTNAATATLQGNTEAGAQVTLSQLGSALGTATAAGDGSFSFAGVALAAGANAFHVSAVDAAGNARNQDFSFTRDSTPPVLTAQLQNDTGTSTTDGITSDPTLVGSATDNLPLVKLEGAVDPAGPPVFFDVTSILQPDGSFLLRPQDLVPGLADGIHHVIGRATDSAGNQTTAQVDVVLDRAAPVIASFDLAPASDTGTAGDHVTSTATVTLQGSTEAGAQLTLKQGNTVLGTATAANDGSFSFAGVSLAQGDNAFTLLATDVAGNQASQDATFTRQSADQNAPTLAAALQTDTGRSASDAITSDATIAGNAADDVGVAVLQAVLDPGSSPVFTDILSLRQADGSFVLTRAFLDGLAGGTLADGTHTLRVRAADAAGNATLRDVTFTLDTSAPTLTIGIATADALPGTSDQTAAAIVQLSGLTEAGATVSLASQSLGVAAGGGGVVVMPGVNLALGDNQLQFTVTDAAGNTAQVPRTLTRVAQTGTDAVLTWDDIALRAIQLDVTDPPIATRLLAMESLAVYDTLAAIEGTPAYMVQLSVSGPVSADAAVAVAAHRILSLQYPAQQAIFDQALVSSLAAVPDGAAKDTGIALGLSVANAIYQLRLNDGFNVDAVFTGSTDVGKWRPVGPMFGTAQDPQWATVTPFAMTSPDELRRGPPPALDTAAYADAVNEIKSLGDANSTTRTADQTQQAQFWADGLGSFTPPGHWNQIASQIAADRGNSLSANARLFAELNVALADSAIACWDTKYTYDSWRPETAIQLADTDGNPDTTADAGWRPLLLTPPHPEYVSGHSTFSAAAASILADTFGDNTSFTTTSATLPGVTRSFTSFTQAAEEAGRSRIYGGIHFEFSNQAGQALGRDVAAVVLQRFALSQDTQAPTVVMDASAPAVSHNLTLTGQVLDNLSGVAAAQFRVDNGALQDLALDTNNRFTITTALAVDGSADGSHTITLIARDAAGNISAGFTRGFVLDTQAPVVTLTSITDGASLVGGMRLTGAADAGISGLTLLQYSFDGGPARSMVFNSSTGSFDAPLDFSKVSVGDHQLAITAQDGAGNQASLQRSVHVDTLAPFLITGITPVDGSQDIGVTQRPQVVFSRAVNTATLDANSFYATDPAGNKLAATIVPALDGSFAWLFFTDPMPGGTLVTLHVEGSRIRAAADGSFLDADANGTAGGTRTISFTTVSTTPVAGTKLVGKVVDPGQDLQPMTFDDIRRGPDGIIHTADDVFLHPIAHAKVYILGREDQFVFTDANGNFELDDVPAGTVKVAVDGRTATNPPSGYFFPEMVMDAELKAGITNTVMESMGSQQERLANAGRVEVYLPRVPSDVLQPVSDTQPTTITVDNPQAASQLTNEQRARLTLTINPGSAVDAQGNPVANVQIGISTVPPELVMDMLPPGVLQHTFDITIQAPGVATFTDPVKITFPNVFNAAPGTKLDILSFDHTTGKLVINGTGTVSADGLTVVSDDDSGVRAPGWHGMAPPGPTGRKDNPKRPNPGPPPPPPPNPPSPPPPPPPPIQTVVVPPLIPGPIIITPPAPPPTTTVPPPWVHVNPPGSIVVVPGSPNAPDFNIEVRLPDTGFTPAQKLAIFQAAHSWEQVITGDIPADLTPEGVVDDLRIHFAVGTVDGAGHQLASTQIQDIRSGVLKLPSLATITLDSADIATLTPEQLFKVLQHEIGHALGFGELFAADGLVNSSNAADPEFTGAHAVAAYSALTGTAQTGVPLDNRSGANATHWREALFGNELMTPLLDPNGPYPLSALSIAALQDLGYTVNPAAADAFAMPGASFVFHPNATDPVGTGNGELLAPSLPAPDPHLFFAFDFGPASAPVAPGFAGVTAATTYNATLGYGWAPGSQVVDKLTGNGTLAPLTADFAQVTDGTFQVDLPNGTYDVIVDMGDDAADHQQASYTIEGVRRGAITTGVGEHTGVTHRVEVVDGQMNIHFTGIGAGAALNALEIHQVSTYVTPVSNVDYTSGTFFLAIENLETGFVMRDKVEVTAGSALCINGVVLSPNTAYRQYVYQVNSNTVGVSEFVTPASGVNFDLPEVPLGNHMAPDTDGDGLDDLAEFIVGTRPDRADTDGDGIGDRAELLQDLDPLGGQSLPSGLIASQPVQGSAVALDVVDDPADASKLTAYLATGTRGLAVVDVSQYTAPIVLADIDLPGNAQDVAVDAQRGRALVAAGDAGLLLLDVSNRASPQLLDTIALIGGATHVEVRDGLAFVTHGNSLSVVDINTGEVRQTLATGSASSEALAVDGNRLFTLNDGGTLLRSYTVTGGVVAAADSLALPSAGRSLFVADGVAWIGAEGAFLGGVMTANVADAANLALLSGPDSTSIGGRAVALNGSGLGVAVGTPGGVFGAKALDVINTGDPANTGAFVTRYLLPDAPQDVRIAGGMAYVAAGSSGLFVVNYAGFDNLGVAPTVTISADAVDADPGTPGVQVLEGRSVRVLPQVTEDVQIRNLELLVNGQPVAADASYPYELFAQAPLIAAGGSSMTIQVRATDTGGNVGLSNILTLDVVPDTFPPQLGTVSLVEGSRIFFLRSVDMAFDEPLDTARLDPAKVHLVRAGADGQFDTADDVVVPVRLDTRNDGQTLSAIVDGILPPGDYRFTVDAADIADRAGNQLAASIVRHFSIRPASDVHAAAGVPDIPTAPSANPGQQIALQVPFDPSTARMDVAVTDQNGNTTTRTLQPVRFDPATSVAFFTVPVDAVTGDATLYSLVGNVRTDFPDGTFPLQILPVISDVQVQSLSGDGSTATLLIAGLGFVEAGGSQYNFGTVQVVDSNASTGPDVFGRSDPVLGFVPTGFVQLTVPLSNGAFGPITVHTAGGTSAAFSVSVDAIQSTALRGTPADGTQASANPGQAILLHGTGLTTDTDVLLRWTDINGNPVMTKLSPTNAAADGTSATVILPRDANGVFGLQVFGSASQPLLQIVPVLDSYDVSGTTLTVFGGGLVEGGSSYAFPGSTIVDASTDSNTDVYYNSDFSAQNGRVNFNNTVPNSGLGGMTVTTAGGTSAPLNLNVMRVSGTVLNDVALASNGDLWTSDNANPTHLLRIDPATGNVLQSITLNATDFGTQFSFSLNGLQFVPAMSLGGTAVPAGSLLVFNGQPNPDRVVAVNPSTGATIAVLSLAGNFDATAGIFDAASGHLFVLENNGPGNRMQEVDPATGATINTWTLPVNIQNHAGIAIDPVTGNFWIGSTSTGGSIVEVDRTGAEIRRADLSTQGVTDNEITGLAFAADGTLRVSSTAGVIYKVRTDLDTVAVKTATLLQVLAAATNGTAANAAQAAANVGQVIELVGTNFGAGTRVLFDTRDNSGTVQTIAVTPLAINGDGTRMQVLVPDQATTGNVRVVNVGTRNVAFGGQADSVYRDVTVTFTAGGPTATVRFADTGLEDINNESWGLDNVRLAQGATTLFDDDFEGAVPSRWGNAPVDASQRAALTRFLGRFNNGGQTLNLDGLTAGQSYTLTFDLMIFDSWDGTSRSAGPDVVDVSVDGTSKFHEAFTNNIGSDQVQTFRQTPGVRLQVVPTLTATDGRPAEENSFALIGSGFMEGASTVTIGGVALADPAMNLSPFDVTGGRNDRLTLVAPRTLDGPIRITTEGGFAQIPAPSIPAQPPSQFTGIVAASNGGQATDPGQPAATTGQTIVLQGQGLTNSTLVQFQGVDDNGVAGTLTRTGNASNGGTQLSIIVPALARTGAVTVLGSGQSFNLQVVPTLRAVSGTVAAGNTLLVEGTGLVGTELVVTVGGQPAGSFSVRTIVDGFANNPDQQLLSVVVPIGATGNDVVVSTAGGTADNRRGIAINDLGVLAQPADTGDTLAGAANVGLLQDSKAAFTETLGDGTQATKDVDLYKLVLDAHATIRVGVASNDMSSFVRIFDVNGNQLATRSFGTGDTSQLAFTVDQGGSYFVGVSGNGNFSYDPATAGSGVAASTGTYRLNLEAQRAGSGHLLAITGAAASGAAANASLPSANTGQTITLNGAGLLNSDRVVFTTIDSNGTLGEVLVTPNSIDLGAQTITVVVPDSAITGRVRLERESAGVLLQVVPTVADVAMSAGSAYIGGNLQLRGTGFAEGGITVSFGAQQVVDRSTGTGIDVFGNGANNNFLNLTVPATSPVLPSGPVRVTTAGGTSAVFGLTFTGITATAGYGTPAQGGQASANPGQTITINGTGLDASTDVVFQTVDSSGNPGDIVVHPTIVGPGGTSVQVAVPVAAVTGQVRVVGDANGNDVPLQILPAITDVQVESVAGDGSSATVLIAGSGFIEGGGQYQFGSQVVLDGSLGTGPDVFGRSDPVLGFVPNGFVRVTVPLSNSVFGPITTRTAGGTSAAFTVSLSSIEATAVRGTPADAGQASANPGQAILLHGTGLTTDTDVLLRWTDINGNPVMTKLSPTNASADGTRATLILPRDANGVFGLQVFGSTTQPLLQIVPVLDSYDVSGTTLTVFGGGLVEGGSSYAFPGSTIVDASTDSNTDVYYNSDFSAQNGRVNFNNTVPNSGLGGMTVTTAGGTSAPLNLNVMRVSGGVLNDVAVAPNGDLWTTDNANPTHLLRIDPSTGNVLQSITLNGTDFGTQFTFSLNGLQFVPAMSLGGTAVPAGSLLVFNGQPNPDRVVAVNPSTGATIAVLSLAANFDATAGIFDATSGHLFILENNGPGNRMQEVNPATGATINTLTLPVNIQNHAGIAIDPVTGNFWIGSTSTGGSIVEVDRTGAEIRRADLSTQGVTDNEITGLAFAADGTLRVSSTAGVIYKVRTDLDTVAVKTATLLQVLAAATNGTAANAAQAAANVGQVIELVGTNFGAGTRVLFDTRDNSGNVQTIAVAPLVINGDGTRMQVLVPDQATTANVRVVNVGTRNVAFGGQADSVYRDVTVTFTAGGPTATVRFADTGLEDIGNESWGLDNVRLSQGATTLFDDDFESTVPARWASAPVDGSQRAALTRFLGRFNNGGQTLNLDGLTQGQSYTLTFDLMVFDSWDGTSRNGGPDTLDVSVDGTSKFREAFTNNIGSDQVQTFRQTPGVRLQVVPTLAATDGRPGEENTFALIGSGFMEGASTVTIGGVALSDPAMNLSPFDVTGGRNDRLALVAPRTLDGPIRITTEGGFAQIPAPSILAQAPSQFTGIVALASSGQPTDAGQPSATTGQTIVLQGQGFTNSTLVQFQGVDDNGVAGTLTRTGNVGNGGTQLSIIVPALAKTGAVTVLGSGQSINLQIVPTLRAAAGTVSAGNTLLIEGTGLAATDLVVTVGGQTATTFSVRTIVDGNSTNLDQQLLTVLVPSGVSGNAISVATTGGSSTLAAKLLTGITTAAASGTPANASLPSANAGQAITLTGTGLLSSDRVVFMATDSSGNLFETTVTPTSVNVPGQTITVTVPDNAVTGRVRLERDTSGIVLQVVPTLNDAFMSAGSGFIGNNLQLHGSGFVEAATTVTIGGHAFVDRSVSFDLDIFGSGGNNNFINMTVPSTTPALPTGPITVTTAGGTSAAFGLTFTGISASATSGTPANPGQASANPGQTITINGSGLDSSSDVVFQVVDGSGNRSDLVVHPTTAAADGSSATVVVPVNVLTGNVRVVGDANGSDVLLQILPTVTDVQVESVAGDGSSASVLVSGIGFVEGDGAYQFGNLVLLDASVNTGPDVFGRSDPTLGFLNSGTVRLTVPLSDGVFGPITVRTAGGTSAAFTTSLASVESTATRGTPADAGQASANPGQTVVLHGTGLSTNSDVLLRWTDINGNRVMQRLSPATAAADGSSATLVIPRDANGVFALQLFGSTTQPLLQIVPVLDSFDVNGTTLTLFGGGLVEGAGSYAFPGATVVDASTDGNIDVYYNADFSAQNGRVIFNNTVPNSGLGSVSVTNAGGTSDPLALNFMRVTSGVLNDVAVSAAGALWTADNGNPGHLLRIDRATGSVLQSITLNGPDFGTQFTFSLTGLQFTGAMTLGSTAVPAGSLLVFNGQPNPDRVTAVDPATGNAIASLSLGANIDATAGLYDATTGHLFLLENNGPGSRMQEVDPVTGAVVNTRTLPVNIQNNAGIAIDPVTGNFWVGGSNNAGVVVLVDRTGAEVRRVNLASQGVDNNEVSGLAFDTDGKLLVASTAGVIYKVSV
ncbi:phosphatase PAP2 family protein [Ramlibacter sp. G-1-2-2]|uniref:Phosphatase PAP2 family protein n=1 Tax=Ramlibacter agri TaxID=2728837 RepID=A0A848H5M9_9BURK|nr:phosphatase PAP2 family protein [Ramlibacter agri]